MNFLPTLPPPPDDDSEDLTDQEVETAIKTTDESHLAKLIAEELSPGHASVGMHDARYARVGNELRYRKPHLFCRVTLGCPGEPDKVLVYQIDWLQRGQT